MDKKYRIGELADLFGITKEGIRYLERQGLITSVRDEENGYRYYDRASTATLKTVRTYQRLGLSLNEIYECMTEKDEEQIFHTIEGRCDELRKKIAEEQALLDELTHRKNLFEQYRQAEPDSYEIVLAPEMLFLSRMESRDKQQTERETEAVWTRNMPPVSLAGRHYHADGTLTSGYGELGSIVEKADADRLGLPIDHRVIRIPEQLCVHGIVLSQLQGPPDIAPMLAWAKDKGYNLGGAVFARLLFQRLPEEHEPEAVHEVWVPVRPAGGAAS